MGSSHCQAAAGVSSVQKRLQRLAFRIFAGIGPEGVGGHNAAAENGSGCGGGIMKSARVAMLQFILSVWAQAHIIIASSSSLRHCSSTTAHSAEVLFQPSRVNTGYGTRYCSSDDWHVSVTCHKAPRLQCHSQSQSLSLSQSSRSQSEVHQHLPVFEPKIQPSSP